MIRSFRCRDTQALFSGKPVRRFGSIARVAFRKLSLRKLAILDAAAGLNDLQIPPGNRLEPLRGDRHGQHSIRINDQFRLCFHWTEAGPEDVEIVDYH
ncbi:type II toxin-antitoxin system RelE/ParE family toxin [Synechococcus sp. CS-602]|nr:type II toxin-antitoxin system RelE/ParE family toxin [Synechococcus sp. SynAce01]MCT0202889.1 type II toxin-antitoxin system RelE/ParE family toxin [Synechococcus sp. CS-603]MCT0204992.1 type II toxin-antitoxin system RelE/ParE family toxin [Synechococcus sp. CS-602]MCT0245126.1 type II toxin-antitoxin system RelE/ParE family toxin [Synechococcus sp. CS-601]MCT4364581.1 type II toxin-antitoxin system RelE/ParE family toxin [Candidatus Regnicoccus frigidus MAG-AL1]MCT4368422.1 type II toxin